MRDQTFLDLVKSQFRNGSLTIRLMAINIAVFLFLNLLEVIQRLVGGFDFLFIANFISNQFILDTDLNLFVFRPWTLITYSFAHLSFFHLFSNMLMLYFAGQLFEQLFSAKKLLVIYLFGGIFGGLLEIIAHIIFPTIIHSHIVGASGSIMAIFSALAFYRPNLIVNLFGVLPIRIIFLAGLFILTDFVKLGRFDGTAHFAHLGGVLFGILSIRNVYSKNNLLNNLERFLNSISSIFSKKEPKLKVQKGGRTASFKTDEEYNMEAKDRQARIDAIFDKISKSGYESLTKAEKDFLFRQSQNGK